MADIVSLDHVDLMVSAMNSLDMSAVFWPGEKPRIFHPMQDLNRTGSILLNENLRSVMDRYPEEEFEKLPGALRRVLPQDYEFAAVPRTMYSWVDILKACDGYEYQSCEHDDWPKTLAHQLVNSLRRLVIHHLDGYEESTAWDWDRPTGG